MKPLQVDEIRIAIRGRWRTAAEPVTVTAVTIDTRTAQKGELFVAIRGESFDGHNFLAEAAAAGCPAAIVNADADIPAETAHLFPGGVVTVEDTVVALGYLASWHRRQSRATVVAVTGSNGKTTTKRMIHAMLASKLTGSCSPKSFNNQIGLPLTLLAASPADDYVICEIGTNAPGEIAALSRIAQPDVAVITSVSAAHLAGLKSIEQIAVEKASILSFLADDGLGVVNADSPELATVLGAYKNRHLVSFGTSDSADVRLTGYQPCGPNQRFQINDHLWVDLPMPGRHNAMNALAAMAVAKRLGLDEVQAAEALASMDQPPMRMEWIDAGKVTIISDCYNANPASMAAAADVLAESQAKRRVMILGDMRELGPSAEALHRELGKAIAARGVDFLIGIGELGRYIAMGAAECQTATETFESVDAAEKCVASLLRAGDMVLLKASRSVGLEALVDPIRSAFESPRSKSISKKSSKSVSKKSSKKSVKRSSKKRSRKK